MQVASFDSSPGDSGGTMFYPNPAAGNKRLYGSHSHSDDNGAPPPPASEGQRRGWYSSHDWQVWTLQHHDSGSGPYGLVVSPCFDSDC